MWQKYLIGLLLFLLIVFLGASALTSIVAQTHQAREAGRLARTIKEELLPASQIARDLTATLDLLEASFLDAAAAEDVAYLEDAARTREAFLELASADALESSGGKWLRSVLSSMTTTSWHQRG